MIKPIEQEPKQDTWNKRRTHKVDETSNVGAWQYGLKFAATPQLIMKVVTEVLGELDTVLI